MYPGAGLDDMEKSKFFILSGLEPLEPLGRPARSQSLYRLRYRGISYLVSVFIVFIL
jgi:hypothetical protein